MKPKGKPSSAAAELRRKAEEQLRTQKTKKGPGTEQDTQRLLHELQVHQIELEMQNEELKQARVAVEAGLERYTDLYDFAPVGYFMLGRNGTVRQANLTGARLLGVERSNLANRRFGQFVCDADRKFFSNFLAEVFEGRADAACEVGLRSEQAPRSSSRGSSKASLPRYVRIEASITEDGQACRAMVADITDRKRADERIESLARFPGENPNPVLRVDAGGAILYANAPAEEKLIRPWGMRRALPPSLGARVAAALSVGAPTEIESTVADRTYMLMLVPIAKAGYANLYARDITDRKQTEARQSLAAEVLGVLNRPNDLEHVIDDILRLLKSHLGFDAVGIRLRQGDDFPYFVQNGFPDHFVQKENSLCARDEAGRPILDSAGNPMLECMCGNILMGRTNPGEPFFTEGGSFWTNSTTDLLASTSEKDRQGRTRNRCNGEGYESVALIPLRSGEAIIGLLQLNDHRRGCLSIDLIRFLEGVSASIGVAVKRQQAAQALRENEQRFRQVFENMSDGVAIYRAVEEGQDFVFVDMNPAGQRSSQVHRDEIIGRRLTEVFPGVKEMGILDIFRRVWKTGQPETQPQTLYKDKRIQQWMENYVCRLPSGLLAAVYADVTARRQADERHGTVLKTAMDGFWVIDSQGRILDVNDAFCQMTGYGREELLKMSIPDLEAVETPDETAGHIRQIITTGKARFESRHRCKDGRIINVEVSVTCMGGAPGTMFSFARDITNRKQAEAAIRESEARYRSLVENIKLGITLIDADYRVVTTNTAQAQMFGEKPCEFTGKECFREFEKREHVCPHCPGRRAMATRQPAEADSEGIREDGSRFAVHLYAFPVLDPEGRATGFVEVVEDISDRKRVDAALREAQERLALTASATGVGMFDLNMATGKVHWTEALESLFGYAPATTTTTTTTTTEHDSSRWTDRVHPEDLARVEAQMRVCAREHRPFQEHYRIIWPDKSEHWVETKGVFLYGGDGKAVRMLGVVTDITERKLAEEEMKWKTAFLEAQVDATLDGVLIVDEKGDKVIQNQRCVNLWKIPQHIIDNPDDQQQLEFVKNRAKNPMQFIEKVAHLYAHPKETSHDEVEFKDGMILERFSAPVIGKDGTYFGRIWTFHDITEHKRSETALAEETTRRRALFEQSPDGIVILDPATGRILEFSTAAHKQLGYSREEFARLSLADIDAMETPNQTRERIAGVLRGRRSDFETLHRTKQGEIRNVLVTAQSIDVLGHSVYQAVWRDITERKRLQEQLIQSQKMEAIGQLAGGVAHDFRNQLTVIKGFGEMLLRRSLVKEEGVDKLQQILKATDRSTLLTGHLLAFSRKQTLQPEQVDLTELVADIGKAIPRLTGEDVRVYMNPCPTPCMVQIDPGQFQQALINLVTNARDAMPKGGDLTIATSRQELGDAVLQKHPDARPGTYAVVAVTDTGCGMDDDTLAKIFEPFFTTKEVGQGTGLGLAMVYGFAKQSGGIVEVESQPSKGSTFTLFFPEYQGHDKTRKEGGDARDELPSGTETILVVEDEEQVRQMLVESLRESGYAVLHASTAAEATTELERAGVEIDMLITDVVMPGGSGVDLAQTIQKTRPKMPVLYVSGYAERDIKKRGVTIDAGPLVSG